MEFFGNVNSERHDPVCNYACQCRSPVRAMELETCKYVSKLRFCCGIYGMKELHNTIAGPRVVCRKPIRDGFKMEGRILAEMVMNVSAAKKTFMDVM